MKILITGAGGWLGSELTERLLEQGNIVRAFVLFSSDRLVELKSKYTDQIEIIEGDICSRETVEKSLKGIEVVYHLAAKVHSLPNSKAEEEEFFKINTYATEQLFNLCIENKVNRVVFYSSVSVYGESKELIGIDSPKKSETPYAKSKLMAEELGLRLVRDKGLKLTIIEPVTVYGGNDVGNFEKLKSLAKKGFLPIFGDGDNKKTIIYYKDLITMTINIATATETIGNIIICGTETISLNSIVNALVNNKERKVFVVKINNTITQLVINIFDKINIGATKKIARHIKVLSSNNEYELEKCKKYIKDYTNFCEYYR